MSTLLKLQTITAQVVCMTTSELLGSLPASEELLEKYIKSKALKELQKLEKQLARAKEPEEAFALEQKIEELQEAVGEDTPILPTAEDRLTVFARDEEDNICLLGYQITGMLKETAQNFSDAKGLKNAISRYVSVKERFITLYEDEDLTKPLKNPDRILERPLRAFTPQGFIVSIARSELVEEPAYFRFTLQVVKTPKTPFTTEDIKALLEAGGEHTGLLQWRSAGYGRFKVLDFKVL
ncbi:hypothetical protein [Pampinifervens florentissimum]|uniref:hypothetical protein n=1 Tax=Pampinifervens florentissimum TaxID=1632019 RepID=UPI0013B489F3|nr:hypothetical protein [Hydrogenobacter sp. T-8]QID32310.1 hypothetical protein G3M65_00350 [Hydrogenobacter sp. T-8]